MVISCNFYKQAHGVELEYFSHANMRKLDCETAVQSELPLANSAAFVATLWNSGIRAILVITATRFD